MDISNKANGEVKIAYTYSVSFHVSTKLSAAIASQNHALQYSELQRWTTKIITEYLICDLKTLFELKDQRWLGI